uniref:Uncharacterized protein n=1 Tax=Rhizophora mucronata TaxID=61149 RepID=A0A2P2R3Z9_RHIMU
MNTIYEVIFHLFQEHKEVKHQPWAIIVTSIYKKLAGTESIGF